MKLINSVRALMMGALFGLLFAIPTLAQHARPGSAAAAPQNNSPYAPYEFLIGDWDVSQEGKPPALVMHFQWRGNPRGYIFYSTSLVSPAGKEELHFEGLLIWNAVNRNLDMLLTLDPVNGTTQESGTMSIEPDGTVVRTIRSTGPQAVRGSDGKPTAGSANFRQTFKQISPNQVRTVVMRETPTGWVPTFPGSENLLMTKRTGRTPSS